MTKAMFALFSEHLKRLRSRNHKGARWVVYWDGDGESRLSLPIAPDKAQLFDEFAGGSVAFEKGADSVTIPAGPRRYLKTSLSAAEVKAAFAAAKE